MNVKGTIGLLFAVSLVAGGARANVDHIDIGPPAYSASTPVIRVVNDKTHFTEVVGSTAYHASGSVDCSGTHKVKNTLLGVGRFNIGNGFHEYAPDQVFDQSLGANHDGSMSLSGSVVVPAEKAHLGTLGVYKDPVDMCNAAMASLGPTPHERIQVLHDGFELDAEKQLSFAARCRWNVSNDQLVSWAQDSMDVPVKVVCEGNPDVALPPPPEPMELVRKFEIEEARLFIDDVVEGYCVRGFDVPVAIKIRSNGVEGSTSFRFAHNGAWGGVTNLHFTEIDDTFRHEVMLHIPPSDMGADGDLQQFQMNQGSADGPVNGMAAEPSRVHEIALKILEPDAKVWDTETVSVKCTGPRLNPIIGGTAQDLRAEPKVPVAPVTPAFSNAPATASPAEPDGPGKARKKRGVRKGRLKLEQAKRRR